MLGRLVLPYQVHREILDEVSLAPSQHLHEAVLGSGQVVVIRVQLLVLVLRDERLVVLDGAL